MNYKSEKQVTVGVTCIDDDNDVKLLLAEHDRASFLQMHPEIPRLFCSWVENGYFFVVCLFRNYPDPIDNGLACWKIDLSLHSPNEAIGIFDKIQQHGSSGPALALHWLPLDTQQN